MRIVNNFPASNFVFTVLKPINENTNTPFSRDNFNVKFPPVSVVTPSLVESNNTVTPGMGCPFSSITLPFIIFSFTTVLSRAGTAFANKDKQQSKGKSSIFR